MRVLHLMSGLVPGGVQSVVLNYANKVSLQGVVFDYAVQKSGDPQIEAKCIAEGSKIYPVADIFKHPIRGMVELYKLLKQHPEYKVIHVHQNDVNTLSLFAAKLAGVKVRISHSHSFRPCNSKLKRILKSINHRLLKFMATDLWACSAVAYEWLYDAPFSEDKKHSFILHNAVDLDKFAYCEHDRAQYRQELELGEAFACVCVATLSPNKNQQYLLRVFKELTDRKLDAKLLFVGDGDHKNTLQAMCAELELEDKVRFLGNRQDVFRLLNAADCMLLASMFEGLPVSALEGQVNGLPCVLSKAVPEEVRIGENVYFLDITEQAVIAWADIIQELMVNRYPRDIRMEENARQHGFDIYAEGVRLAEKYKELNKA